MQINKNLYRIYRLRYLSLASRVLMCLTNLLYGLGTSMNSSCPVNITCDCENEKDKQETPDAKEALFDKQFQDKLFSTVFTKQDDNDKDETTRPPTVRTFPNVVRNKTTVSQGCDNDSKVSSLKRLSSLIFIISTCSKVLYSPYLNDTKIFDVSSHPSSLKSPTKGLCSKRTLSV